MKGWIWIAAAATVSGAVGYFIYRRATGANVDSGVDPAVRAALATGAAAARQATQAIRLPGSQQFLVPEMANASGNAAAAYAANQAAIANVNAQIGTSAAVLNTTLHGGSAGAYMDSISALKQRQAEAGQLANMDAWIGRAYTALRALGGNIGGLTSLTKFDAHPEWIAAASAALVQGGSAGGGSLYSTGLSRLNTAVTYGDGLNFDLIRTMVMNAGSVLKSMTLAKMQSQISATNDAERRQRDLKVAGAVAVANQTATLIGSAATELYNWLETTRLTYSGKPVGNLANKYYTLVVPDMMALKTALGNLTKPDSTYKALRDTVKYSLWIAATVYGISGDAYRQLAG